MIKRDRYDAVMLPILVNAKRDYKKRIVVPDGWVKGGLKRPFGREPNSYTTHDLAVSVLPLDALQCLQDGEKLAELTKSYTLAFPEESRLTLVAFTTLVQAVNNRDLGLLKKYKDLMIADRLLRWKKVVEDGESQEPGLWGTWSKDDERFWANSTKADLVRKLKRPLTLIASEITERLEKAQFVVWWRAETRQFAPGLYCPDLPTALAALLVSRIISPLNWATCARQGCDIQFIRIRRGQKFHDPRCGNAQRQIRARERERERRKREKERRS